ncbi:MAG: T9SS type A sorting domain-containing protein [Saprospiraceae bacterium]
MENHRRGIRVTGGNVDFDVKFTNGAIVENVSQSAVSMFPPLPWPEAISYGNGILQADNTTFNNVNRMVEFMSWSSLPNHSFVEHCTQNGGRIGISNWNCIGIEVKDNVFNDISENSIVTETGTFIIEGNEFHSGQNDILFANVSPGLPSNILENQFYGDDAGVRAIGTTVGAINIELNQFQTGEFDIFMDGENEYMIDRNDFTSDFGIVSINNGSQSNDVSLNDFEGNYVGVMPVGDNNGYIFYENCFSTTFADAWIDGTVNTIILNPDDIYAANNCFTHGGNYYGSVYDMTGNPEQFTYIEPLDKIVDCRDPILAHSNISLAYAPANDSPCGIAGSGFPDPPTHFNPCKPQISITNLIRAIKTLNSSIEEIQNDPNLTEEQKEYFISFYKRCLKRVYRWLYVEYIKDKRFVEARQLLDGDNSDAAFIAIFASYIFENKFDDAKNYLLNLPNDREKMIDFKTIQLINLKRIKSGKYYVSNPEEINIVETIARKTHNYAGFAKALYYHLTGKVISSEIPVFENRQIKPRNIEKTKIPKMYIFPNPVSDELNINIENVDNARLIITDITGKEIFNKDISKNLILNTSLWNAGIYFVSIKTGQNETLNDKILIIH